MTDVEVLQHEVNELWKRVHELEDRVSKHDFGIDWLKRSVVWFKALTTGEPVQREPLQ